ncbi:MAG: glycosyltransferase family 39 protein [Chloroflexi bacterium]|nr:glycosyltransferase family 39 protein [Chloroflexota bacterium]
METAASSATAATPSPPPRAAPNVVERTTRTAALGRLAAHPDALLALGLFLVALVPRLLYAVWAPVFIGGDSIQYFQPVHDLLNGQGFSLTLKRPPLYPWLLLASQVTFGTSFAPVIVLQHVLGAGVAALTFGIARLSWGWGAPALGRWSGGIAALLVAFSSQTLRWEQFLMTESVFTFLFTLAVFSIVLGLRHGGLWPWLAAGVVLGFAMLTRSGGQVALLVIPPMLVLVERSWRSTLAKSTLVFGACAVITVPWMFRNQAVHGAFTTAGAAGQNLVTFTAIIHRPDFSFEDPLVRQVDADPKKATARKMIQQEMEAKLAKPQRDITGLGIFNHIREETKMSQVETDRVMQEIAVRAILSRPLVYLGDAAGNVVAIFLADESKADWTLRYSWDLWEQMGWRGPMRRYVGPASDEQEAAFPRVEALESIYHPASTAGPILVLFALGLAIALGVPRWRPVLAAGLSALGLIVVHAAVVGAIPRYRVPVEPLIDVVAIGALGAAIAWLYGRLRARPGCPR